MTNANELKLKNLLNPQDIMKLASAHLDEVNGQFFNMMKLEEEGKTAARNFFKKIESLFSEVVEDDLHPDLIGLVLVNNLYRSMVLLKMFPPAVFDRMLSEVLTGVGVADWKQQEIDDAV